jgi:sodium/potassium-transporting ATPase subunit alpha
MDATGFQSGIRRVQTLPMNPEESENNTEESHHEPNEVEPENQVETRPKLTGLAALLPIRSSNETTDLQMSEKIKNAAKEITDSFHAKLKVDIKPSQSPRMLKNEKLKAATSRFGKLKKSLNIQKSEPLTDLQAPNPEVEQPIQPDEPNTPSDLVGIGLSNMSEHTLAFDKLCEKLQIKVDAKLPHLSTGLSTAQVAERKEVFGENKFLSKKKSALHVLMIECLTNLFNVLLYASGLMYLVIYSIQPESNFESVWIGSTFIAVGIINACIEFYELYKIRSILHSFQTMIQSITIVFRDGKQTEMEASELVPGDLIYLQAGDKVPADCIVFSTNDLRVDGSNLTGENEPFVRLPNLNGFPEETDPFECSNVLFSTDVIVSGDGYAIVVQTGENAIASKIKRLARDVERPKGSVLSREINSFIKTIGFLAVITALIFFIWAIARGRNFTYAATFGIGILIAWIPQGLPFTVTMMLALSGRRMAEQNVLVKDLHGIETLGTITMLATDKTGTLTKNEMNVSEVWINETFLSVLGNSESELKAKPLRLDISGIAQLMHVCVTCTRARFEPSKAPDAPRLIIGDSTEAGLLRFAADKLKNIDQIDTMYPKLLELPFSSDTKTHLTIHRKSHSNGGITLHIKGAPEKIWSLCSSLWLNGKIAPIEPAHAQNFQTSLTLLTKQGKRVLGCAILQLPGNKFPDNFKFDREKMNYPQKGYTFLGMVAMIDPPKDGIDQSIAGMKGAGIKVVMITGDNALTAESIGRKVNLIQHKEVVYVHDESCLPIPEPDPHKALVVHGHAIDHFSDLDWFNSLSFSEIIFARTLPSHKLDIVKHAQALGHIVAVTGDGVNDGPALKQADMGVAMNKTGSDVSKESARMILLDDNFNSTYRAIQEGRLIFINLKKAIKYSLSHIVAEIIPYLLYVVVPLPLAITPTQMLAVDLGFEMLLTLAFAWEPCEDVSIMMSMPPRKQVTYDRSLELYRRNQEEQQNIYDSMDLLQSTQNLNDLPGAESMDLLASKGDLAKELKTINNRLQNRYQNYLKEATQVADKRYWKKQLKELRKITSGKENGRLLDFEMISWSYLEAGLIELAGCLCTYFAIFWLEFNVSASDARGAQTKANVHWKPQSPDLVLWDGSILPGPLQFEALKQVQSGYYLSMFVIQVFNFFACKRVLTLGMKVKQFTHKQMWIMLSLGFFFAGIIVYTPVTNALFLTSRNLDPFFLLIPLTFGGFLYFYSILRGLALKNGSLD